LGRLSCWSDISHRTSSIGRAIPELDTLRGIAAIIVLADHTSMVPKGMGGNGVWLFFALSGYLLTRPFIERHEAWTFKSLLLYVSRRLARILPMYWVVVMGYFLLTKNNWRWASLHLLFRRGDLHLWTVQQELLFYLLLPGLLFLIAFLGHRNWLKAALLYGLAILSGLFLGPDIIRLHAIHRFGFLPFQVAPFLAGMGGAYLFASLPLTLFQRRGKVFLLLLLLGLLAYCNWRWPVATGSREIWRVGILYSLLLVTVQLPGPSWLSRLLCFGPFRALGVVGYSFYLLHLPMIQYYAPLAPFLGKKLCFLFVGLVTYVLSCLTYTLIEKPCMKKIPAWVARLTQKKQGRHEGQG
jgi:peptidoglycan/LPS O-acetylase OafA/YrhL